MPAAAGVAPDVNDELDPGPADKRCEVRRLEHPMADGPQRSHPDQDTRSDRIRSDRAPRFRLSPWSRGLPAASCRFDRLGVRAHLDEKRFGVDRIQRPGEEEALRQLAVLVEQPIALGALLDALGDRLELERAPEV